MLDKGATHDHASPKELRQFAGIMFVCLALLGGLFLWRGKSYFWCFFVLSAVFAGLGLALPAALGPVRKAWMKLSAVIGWFMSRLILTVLFYLVLTPIGLVLRLLGKDILKVRFAHSSPGTYWVPKPDRDDQNQDYTRQF